MDTKKTWGEQVWVVGERNHGVYPFMRCLLSASYETLLSMGHSS